MAFWGIEVKPGKPFTHKFDDSKGRLHVSMASLGLGKATAKSVLQCNVGNKSPVFLCSLYPEKTESLQLNLEFEEIDEVIFSVIGPRSIHLSGYYLGGGGQLRILNEESESYGEDIADTDTQRSDCSDEEYDDSFIDDREPQVFPPSPVSSGGEESSDNKRPKDGKGNRRRRLKKYQLSDSDDEGFSRQKSTANGNSTIPGLDSEDEDNFPIAAVLKLGTTEKGIQDGEEKADMGIAEGGLPMRKAGLSVDKLLPSEVGHKDGGTLNKKRKERSADGKSRESDKNKDDKTQQGVAKVDGNGLDLVAEDGEKQQKLNDSDLVHENDERPKKKKKKELKNQKKNFEVDNSDQTNDAKENKDRQDEAKDASIVQDPSRSSEQNEKLANDRNKSGEKKVKKKKKKSKAQENDETVNMDTPLLSVEEKNASSIDMESKKCDAKTSKVRTLPNGLVIEELESGQPSGKVASSGKKISIRYVGKLNDGEVVDSNIDSDPYKFRLGAGKVLEGLDVGLEGMRVGEKRRLVIPPSMGYGSNGFGKKIPPNSWLVYEVELVKVR